MARARDRTNTNAANRQAHSVGGRGREELSAKIQMRKSRKCGVWLPYRVPAVFEKRARERRRRDRTERTCCSRRVRYPLRGSLQDARHDVLTPDANDKIPVNGRRPLLRVNSDPCWFRTAEYVSDTTIHICSARLL